MGLFGKKTPSEEEIQKVTNNLKDALDGHDIRELGKAVKAGDEKKAAEIIDTLERRGTVEKDENGMYKF